MIRWKAGAVTATQRLAHTSDVTHQLLTSRPVYRTHLKEGLLTLFCHCYAKA